MHRKIVTLWGVIVNGPDTFPSKLLRFFLQSSLTVLVEECRPVFDSGAARGGQFVR